MFSNFQQIRCENIGIKLRKVLKLRSWSLTHSSLVLSNGIKVTNQFIFNFAMQCIPKVCSLTHKERKHANFKMGLGQIHKEKFKMKPIYTNQPK